MLLDLPAAYCAARASESMFTWMTGCIQDTRPGQGKKKGTDPLLYQILRLENRRSREHWTEHVATNFCVFIFNKAGRRLRHVERAIYRRVLVPLVLRVVDLVVHVRVRKVELLPTEINRQRNRPRQQRTKLGCRRTMSPSNECWVSVTHSRLDGDLGELGAPYLAWSSSRMSEREIPLTNS